MKQGSELYHLECEKIVDLHLTEEDHLGSVEEFEGIVAQYDNKLTLIFSNNAFSLLKPSEQSELMQICTDVLSSNMPLRIQRYFSDQFYVFTAVPLIQTNKETSGVALTGFPISFKIFKDVVLDNMSDAAFYLSVSDDHFIFKGVNHSFLKVSGMKEKDIIDKNVLEIIPEIYQKEYLAKFRQTLKERKIHRWEVNIVYPKGIRYGDLVLTPICLQNECRALIGIVHDITERKLAEIELAKNYSILHELVESASDFIFIKDLDGRYLMINSAGSNLLGKSKFELIGKKDLEIFSEDTASQFMTNDRQTIESKVMQHFEEECYINNKHYYFHSAKGPYRDDKGEIAGTLGITRDITQMKLAERNLAHSNSMLIATLNATADGILVLDTHRTITHFNRRFLDLWKISEELLLNNEYEKILHKVLDQLKNPEECLERLQQLEHDPNLESYDLLFFKDGRMLERYTIPQISEGQVIGRVFSYRDLSRREDAKSKLLPRGQVSSDNGGHRKLM